MIKKIFLMWLLAGYITLGTGVSRASIEAQPLQVGFTGQSDLADWLIDSIDQARSDIKIMVFIFEYEPIADALIRAAARGVNVEVITDIRSAKIEGLPSRKSSVPTQLMDTGVKCYIYDDKPYIMHHKVIFIDDAIFLGSYNFQVKATFNNRENMMKSYSSSLISAYMEEYLRVKLHSYVYDGQMPKESKSLLQSFTPLWGKLRWVLAPVLLFSLIFNLFVICKLYRAR